MSASVDGRVKASAKKQWFIIMPDGTLMPEKDLPARPADAQKTTGGPFTPWNRAASHRHSEGGGHVLAENHADAVRILNSIERKHRKRITPNAVGVHQSDVAGRVKASIAGILRAHKLPPSTKYVLVAGGALYFHGLRSSINDVDLFVPSLPVAHDHGHYAGMQVDAKPTWAMWPNNTLIADSVVIDGVRVMDKKSLLRMKLAMNREKDQADIAALRKTSSSNYDIGFEAGMEKAAGMIGQGITAGVSAFKKLKPVAGAIMTGRDALNSARDATTRVRGSAAMPRPPQPSFSPTSSLASRAGMSR